MDHGEFNLGYFSYFLFLQELIDVYFFLVFVK